MAQTQKIQISNKQIRSITNVGIVVNVVLSIFKIVVGQLTLSMALIADGIHSISDIATDITVLLGVHFGSRKADDKHPYGHGRIETFSAIVVAAVLFFVGLVMIYKAGLDITAGQIRMSAYPAIVVAALSILIKEVLYRATKKVAVKTHSSALYANAWHHRSDALSSVVVVVGLIAVKAGFNYGDQIAAMIVGVMIILVAVHITADCLRELTEAAVDPETIEKIKGIISQNGQIRQWHKLRTRNVGREVFLDLHILVDPDLNISDAHQISENLEEALHQQIYRPVNITVHIEPDLPELRK